MINYIHHTKYLEKMKEVEREPYLCYIQLYKSTFLNLMLKAEV